MAAMKNKVKQWRRESPGNHQGRALKIAGNHQQKAAAPELLVGLFERAGIKMPRAEAFRQALQSMLKEGAADAVV